MGRMKYEDTLYAVIEDLATGPRILDDGEFLMQYSIRSYANQRLREYREQFTSMDLRGRKFRVAKLKIKEA